ncbi:type I glyceraldehyde-3-phosphate dehydrogenase [Candidatus Peribacteria bacterium]|jgi:glyceraldehyde 3-phosphate dehydrogenase|nr:type I glyceraldehyde-3-phosphate dehydrogenase [Candidatus Peribacteria bacterium]MBT4020917.1 type I glyceraldehyde-3-phosphate dehydrogenase [Candidatus Peribacteria bacterium]MBT4240475.1 type I glyceraldehyde-3-phosphate dehydrogenase [Candidatus Peribacteria bacterium]MBT4474359.1 type I glyceraldehyde-3-phosphate dehydrogenase [Candidatus Peribacteria bacterium]
MIKVAINGYGRIGRNVHRQFIERFADEIEVVAINASSTSEMRAYLLQYDSLHGRLNADIEIKGEDAIFVNGKEVRVLKEKDPGKLPWKELNVDVVVESTGKFRSREKALPHIEAGAKRVVVSAPMKDDSPTFVKGVNDDGLTADMDIISNASCTTNCIAPVIKVIDETFGVKHGLVGSVHAYTASQNLLDNKGDDLRRTRSATLSIIPTSTGAVKACGVIFPHLKGKLNGIALRVPLPTVSLAYMSLEINKSTTKEGINEALTKASNDGMNGVLNVCTEPLVSIDFKTDPHSSIVDGLSTEVVDGTAVQILSWYDNEWGYAMRLTEMVVRVGGML